MAILKVAQLGHPVLRLLAKPVSRAELRTRDTQRLIRDMIETMREYDGVGLAAPQVHVSKRIVVIESHRNPRYPDAPEFPLTVMVNPQVTPLGRAPATWWEGCLSMPGLRGCVSRPARARVTAMDRRGRTRTRIVDGFTAIACQHEADHLDGILYLDRMKDLRKLSYEREYQVHWASAKEERRRKPAKGVH